MPDYSEVSHVPQRHTRELHSDNIGEALAKPPALPPKVYTGRRSGGGADTQGRGCVAVVSHDNVAQSERGQGPVMPSTSFEDWLDWVRAPTSQDQSAADDTISHNVQPFLTNSTTPSVDAPYQSAVTQSAVPRKPMYTPACNVPLKRLHTNWNIPGGKKVAMSMGIIDRKPLGAGLADTSIGSRDNQPERVLLSVSEGSNLSDGLGDRPSTRTWSGERVGSYLTAARRNGCATPAISSESHFNQNCTMSQPQVEEPIYFQASSSQRNMAADDFVGSSPRPTRLRSEINSFAIEVGRSDSPRMHNITKPSHPRPQSLSSISSLV
jgi:hypothetical protein